MSRSARRDRAAIASVLAAMALVVLDAGIVAIALPSMAGALGETPARAMMIVSAYQAALLIGLLPCAHIADRFGCRRLFVGGITLFAISAVLCALAPTLPLLVAARILQGLGGAAIMSLGIAVLRFALGPDRLGSAIAWNALVVAICSAVAPLAGAVALMFADWRSLFLIALPAALPALVAAPALPSVNPSRTSVDLPGISLYAAAAALLVAAGQSASASAFWAIALAVAALSCGWRLFARERGRRAPIVPVDLLALGPFRTSGLASVFFFTAQSAGLLALPFYLQLSLGRSAAAAGVVLACWPLAVAATSRVADRLANRFAYGRICAGGGTVLAAGLAAAALWPIHGSIAPLALCAIVCGIGFGLFQVPNNRSMFLAAPADRSAAAGALQATARLAGQTAGALLVSFLLAAAPPAIAPRLAIGVAAVAALLAGWISWPRAPVAADRASAAQPCSYSAR
jgi:DHA2 family multidrug resistance protein-like MFS transporter